MLIKKHTFYIMEHTHQAYFDYIRILAHVFEGKSFADSKNTTPIQIRKFLNP